MAERKGNTVGFLEVKLQLDELERTVAEMVSNLKAELSEAVARQPLNGKVINDGKTGGPFIITVSFPLTLKYKNWCPETFIPAHQTRAVSRELNRATTANAICECVKRMVESGYVGSCGDKTYLNPETRKILRESEVGQYIFGKVKNEDRSFSG